MLLLRPLSVWLALPCLVASCGPSITADQACSDSAKAQCARLDACRHNGTVVAYGDLGSCITRLHDSCMVSLTASGTSTSTTTVQNCALALPNESCQDYVQGNTVTECRPKAGGFASGVACAFSGQCASAYCAVAKGSLCGTCKAPPAIGDPCTSTGCWFNQVCTPMETCQAWVATGGACDNKNLLCVPGQTCVIAAMATAGTCQPSASMLGATCDYKRQVGPACDGNAGLYCAVTNKCVNATYVNAGAVCGTPDKGMTDNVCAHAAGCYPSQTAGMPAMCVALGKEGTACDIMVGPNCVAPARCVVSGGGTSGTCAAPDPTMCM